MEGSEIAKSFGLALATARNEKGRSQEYMALALGISKNTVYNWEKGTSSPNLRQMMAWFGELGVNPSPYILSMVYPDRIKPVATSSEKREQLHSFIDSMPDFIVEQLHFIFFGKHGSSVVSILQLVVAHLHTDMRSRVISARHVIENYETCKLSNSLVCSDSPEPDMDILENSIKLGKEAVMNGDNGYTVK